MKPKTQCLSAKIKRAAIDDAIYALRRMEWTYDPMLLRQAPVSREWIIKTVSVLKAIRADVGRRN